MIAGILVPITFFIVTGIVLFYFLKARHQERMMIIEKGSTGEDLKYLLGKAKRNGSDPTRFVKWGIILIAVGLAILIGTRFEDEITFGLVLLLPGIGLLIYYRIFGKKDKNVE